MQDPCLLGLPEMLTVSCCRGLNNFQYYGLIFPIEPWYHKAHVFLACASSPRNSPSVTNGRSVQSRRPRKCPALMDSGLADHCYRPGKEILLGGSLGLLSRLITPLIVSLTGLTWVAPVASILISPGISSH